MILVTGSSGFVGSALCRTLHERGIALRGAVRSGGAAHQIAVGDMHGSTDWRAALAGCDTVVHLAARVHVMQEHNRDPLSDYRMVNVDATVNLARQAVEAGVRRFVFVSSVKVNGEATHGVPFSASDVPNPTDPYGQSKLEAEIALRKLGRETGLEVVIVRPPLVYGPGVKANFLNLIKLVAKGLPLPFGRSRGLRSMVALDNLVDLLALCCSHPRAPGNTFMVSDGMDLTLGDLVRIIAGAMGKRALLLPVPIGVMRAGARLAGKSAITDRLFGALQVDISQTKAALEWSPVITPQAAVKNTVEQFYKMNGTKDS